MKQMNGCVDDADSMDILSGWVQAEISSIDYAALLASSADKRSSCNESTSPIHKSAIRDVAQTVIRKIRDIATNIFEMETLPNPDDLPIEKLNGNVEDEEIVTEGEDEENDVDNSVNEASTVTEEKQKIDIYNKEEKRKSKTEHFQDKIDLQNSISKTGSCVVYRNTMKKHCSIYDVGTESSFGGFFEYFACYHLMPYATKIIILDINLKVSLAYKYLLRNNARAAPVWDQSKSRFVSMFTVTDFIKFLHKFAPLQQNSDVLDQMEQHTIKDWRDLMGEDTQKSSNLIYIKPENCLKTAARTIQMHNIHRLPVIDENNGNLLAIITNSQLFRFFYRKMLPCHYVNPKYLTKNPASLHLGHFKHDITTIKPTQTVFTALHLFCNNHISALPVVNETNQLVDIYARHDVINLVQNNRYKNLEITISEAIEFRKEKRYPCTCRENDSLEKIMEMIYKAQVHRIFIVDELNHIVGVISLSDILSILCEI